MKLMGLFAASLGWTLLITLATSFFAFVLPFHFPERGVKFYLAFPILTWILINILFNYAMSALVDPGKVPGDMEAIEHEVVFNEEAPKRKTCKKCIDCRFNTVGLGRKPPRTHHCSICDRCVLKMDHHCRTLLLTLSAWINNCVGHYNFRYFFLFLVYITLGCIIFSIFSYHPFLSTFALQQKEIGIIISFVFGFILSVALSLALLGMTCWQAYLISTGKFYPFFIGQTNIEYHDNSYNYKKARLNGEVSKFSNFKIFINEYDYGTRRNWRVFFNIPK